MLINTVSEALSRWPTPRALGSKVIVPTHCLTSGGDIIHVMVEGGRDAFRVHDDGAAIRIFEASGGIFATAPKMLQRMFREHGLLVDNEGVIRSPIVTLDELPATIILVANAAKDAADHLIDRWKPVFRKKFKDAVRSLLENEFPKRWEHDRTIIGHSNKPQRFDFSIPLGHEKTLFLDAVVEDPNSISAAVVRHLDVAQARNASVIQRIVFDDRGGVEWKSSDINLLAMGAPAMPFSEAKEILFRMAA